MSTGIEMHLHACTFNAGGPGCCCCCCCCCCSCVISAFYEMLIEQNWRTARISNISQHLIDRAHRRYGLPTDAADPDVSKAWALLAESAYQLNLW